MSPHSDPNIITLFLTEYEEAVIEYTFPCEFNLVLSCIVYDASFYSA